MPQDHAAAFAHFRRAAELGHLGAMAALAFCYKSSEGTAVDYAQAMRWARRAADQGDAVALNIVGSLYWMDQGVPADRAEAVRWYERAAAAGDDSAKANLRWHAADGFSLATAALERLGLD